VTVRTRAAEGLLRIEVADNGPGIPTDNLPRIFDPFFTTRPEGKGIGLGLSFAYGVVGEHGGRISARNETGGGAAMQIELPLNGGGAAEAWDEAPPRTRAGAPSGKAVLVVDDEEQILALAGALLEGDGHKVESCTDGNRALEVLKGRRFDAIVCDWKMPGLGGREFHERLLASDPAAARRIIFMSGDAANESLLSLARRHGRRCLGKPFQVREFQDAVAAVIGSPA
jgi:CheY-like chemotaxis protein